MNNFDLAITIKAVDKATSVLNQLEKTTGTISSKMITKLEATSESLEKIGQNSLIAGGVLAVGLGFAVKKAADFEQEMSNIKAVTNASSQEMDKLQALAMKMGADTKYSATEAASGIEELEKAGVSTSQVLNGGLKGALDLATAGDLALADAAEIASTALNAFKADSLTVSQAGNILAGAANASATSVQELKYSLAMVSAVASGVGMTFKDTNTALALFAQNGLKGSDAGTSLKTMLMNLQPRTKQQIAAFKELGLMTSNGTNLFYDQHGKLKNLADISELLHSKMKNMTQQQRLYAMETMFGSDAIRASNILFKEGAKGTNDMSKAMSKVTATQVAAIKMDNFKGTIEQLSGSLETLSIIAGKVLIPTFNIMAKGAMFVVNVINKFPKPIQSAIVGFAAISTAGLLVFGSLAIAASTLINSLITLGVVQNATAASMVANLAKSVLSTTRAFIGFNAALLTNPMTWIVAGIVVGVVALVAGTVLLIKNWDKVTATFNKAYTAAKNFFSAIGKGKDVNVSLKSESTKSSLAGIPNSKSAGAMPKYDVGSSMITQTGKAIVHKGEKIIPANRSIGNNYSISFSPNLTISGSSTNIKEEVQKALEQSFETMMRRFQSRNTRLAF